MKVYVISMEAKSKEQLGEFSEKERLGESFYTG